MHDLIADVVKNFRDDSIEATFISFSKRGVSVDRCSHKHMLEFYDTNSGKASSFRSNAFSRSPNKIPNYEKFHKRAYDYLSKFTMVYRDTGNNSHSVDGVFLGHSVWDVAHSFNVPTVQLSDIPTCQFLRPRSSEKHIEEYAENHLDSSIAPIELRCASLWILNKLRKTLNDAGYSSVGIVQITFNRTLVQKVTSLLYKLRSQFALLNRIGKLIWAAIAALIVMIVGASVNWLVPKFLDLLFR